MSARSRQSALANVRFAGDAVLRVEKLYGFHGTAEVLHGISFECRANCMTALLGRNGVGKTSTLLAILGYLKTRGVIEFLGTDITTWPVYSRVRHGFSYIPEERELFPNLSVRENLHIASIASQGGPSYARLYEIFPVLEAKQDKLVGTLSGGQQQMVAIARAWIQNRSFMLIDEPTKGLAPVVIDEVVLGMKAFLSGRAGLIVEQNLKVAAALAEYAIVLNDGLVAWTGPMKDLIGDRALATSLLGVTLR